METERDLISNNQREHNKRVNIVSVKLIKESSILYKGRKINSPQDAVNLVNDFVSDCDREMLLLCCLNTKNQPTSISTISIGSLNASIVHPREVFKAAILSNASSIILFHNHPSGDPQESQEDINITKRLYEVGKLVGIDVIDHIIVGDNSKFTSFKEKGIL